MKKKYEIYLAILGLIVTIVLALVIIKPYPEGNTLIEYYCSPNSFFLGFNFSVSPYCGVLVVIVHIFIGIAIFIGLPELVLFITKKVNQKIRKGVSIGKIKFDESNQEYFVGINITNDESKNFDGQLLLVKKDGKPVIQPLELGISENNNIISVQKWYPAIPKMIILARMNEDTKVVSLIGKHRPIPIFKSRDYILETKLVGKLGGQEIEPITREWIFTYDKPNSSIRLRKK